MYLVVMSNTSTLINYTLLLQRHTYNQNVYQQHELYKVKSTMPLASHLYPTHQKIGNDTHFYNQNSHSTENYKPTLTL